MAEDWFVQIWVFFFGLAIGSFLNVCIHRLPKEMSVVNPGSHCPGCQKPVAWYDNIPLVSYLLLGGKCRHCKQRISFRYFLVELLTGALWLYLWSRFGPSGAFVAGAVLFSILIVITMTDLETGLIPDKVIFPGMAAGLLLSGAFPSVQHELVWYWGFFQSITGLLLGYGILFGIGFFFNWIYKKETMGGGDVKLLAMIGAFVGWKAVPFVFLFAPMFAIPFALYAKFARKAETIPFGPYLALTAGIFFLYSEKILAYFFLN
jgi:leader peptidase (prepilin peptidase)/N-methyltransferase